LLAAVTPDDHFYHKKVISRSLFQRGIQEKHKLRPYLVLDRRTTVLDRSVHSFGPPVIYSFI
jgi:hypothetical protein